jgi:hypothetical protein
MNEASGYKIHRVFGTIVHQKTFPIGETFKITVAKDTDSTQYGDKTLFTKGRVTGVRSDGTPLPFERVPGVNNLSRELIPAGEFTFTAQEDSEWWCINALANRLNKRALQVAVFSLKAGADTTLNVGTKLLVCAGELQINDMVFGAGEAIEVTRARYTTTANSDCYGFLFT